MIDASSVSQIADRGKRDLFFLMSTILGSVYPDLTPSTHGPLCEFFVQKNPNKSFAQQDMIKNRLLMAPRGVFKALDVEELIPTPKGFTPIGKLEVGDLVFGVDGLPVRVTGVSPIQWSEDRFQLKFSTGETVIADAGHLWETDTRRDRDNRKRPCPSIKTTTQIASTLKCRNERNHRVRIAKAIQLPEVEFTIHPYVLGAWLGDGTSSCGHITCDDPQIIDELKREGEALTKTKGQFIWAFNGGKNHPTYRKRYASFHGRLRKLGLVNNKHIPATYLRASFSQRLALLQGLMDMDGSIGKFGSCTFSNTNRVLVEQTRELVASLGFKPTKIGSYDAQLDGKVVGKFHVITFYAYAESSPCPVRLERKKKRLRTKRKASLQNYRQIREATPCNPGFVKCIMVESKDSLYLVGEGFIPTHNTSIDLTDCIQWMLNFPNVTIMMLSGSQDVATRMVEELKEIFLSCADFQELYPDFIPTENIREFGAKGEFWLPRKVRTRIRREPTLMISTLDSVKASIHVDIKKGDDCVNEVNSKKAESNEKVANDWDATRPLLNPGGYNELIGTFYDFSCLYGKTLDRLKMSDDVRFGYPLCETKKGWKVAIYPALTPDDSGNIFNPQGIFFPEKFCIHANADPEKFNLEEAWDENSEHFNAQYMNHPKGTSQDYFPMEMLKKQTISLQKVPMNCTIFGVWDLAVSDNRGSDFTGRNRSDFTVGAIGAFDQNNNIYLIDMFRGRWLPSTIIDKFIEAWKKWPIQRQGIEEAAGHPLLGPGLAAKMRDTYVQIPIDWIKIKRAKDSTIKEILSLSTLLQQSKLWFVDTLPFLPELYVEFSRFGKYSHDDICRAVSMLLFYIGKAQVLENPRMMEPTEIGGAIAYGDEPVCGAGIVA